MVRDDHDRHAGRDGPHPVARIAAVDDDGLAPPGQVSGHREQELLELGRHPAGAKAGKPGPDRTVLLLEEPAIPRRVAAPLDGDRRQQMMENEVVEDGDARPGDGRVVDELVERVVAQVVDGRARLTAVALLRERVRGHYPHSRRPAKPSQVLRPRADDVRV